MVVNIHTDQDIWDYFCSKCNNKKRFHKYGVQLPSKFQEAYDIDEANSNTLWLDSFNKEMEDLKLALDIMLYGKSPPVQY